MMISSTIDYLKSPQLVIKVQTFFGVKYVNKSQPKCDSDGISADTEGHSVHENIASDNSENLIHRRQNGRTYKRPEDEASQGMITECHQTKEEYDGYVIKNKFWYYLFIIGTELGDEIFYASFIPFWFWNIDSAVGRRVIFLWSIVMYVGQSCKDIIRWPRPGPPLIRLQKKWGLEYGMPSTHAMVAISIPFSVAIFTHQRYVFPFWIGLVCATIWCSIICFSRLYLGMHSVLDVVVGILLTVFLMLFLIPLVDFLDFYILTSWPSPFVVFLISVLLIVYYPKSDKWTPTRGDTSMTISVCAGLQIGAWINYQVGDFIPTDQPPPYEIIWPTCQMIGLMLLRTVLGLCCIVASRAISKSLAYTVVCTILGRDKHEVQNSENSLNNRHKIIVDLCYKYCVCYMIGFNTQYLLPNAFKLINIGRPDFYTEI